jgi:hypothetical protein
MAGMAWKLWKINACASIRIKVSAGLLFAVLIITRENQNPTSATERSWASEVWRKTPGREAAGQRAKDRKPGRIASNRSLRRGAGRVKGDAY